MPDQAGGSSGQASLRPIPYRNGFVLIRMSIIDGVLANGRPKFVGDFDFWEGRLDLMQAHAFYVGSRNRGTRICNLVKFIIPTNEALGYVASELHLIFFVIVVFAFRGDSDWSPLARWLQRWAGRRYCIS